MRQSPRQHAQSAKKKSDQDRIYALVADGMAIGDALAAVGRDRRTYENWRYEDKAWARKITEARALRGDHQGAQGLDFIRFRKLYFEHDTPPHHLRMIEVVERQQPGSMTLILGFPQMAKTATFVDRVNYLLGPADPNHRVAIISEGQDLARKILGQIKDRMTETALFRPYIDRYGPFRAPDRELSRPWNADYLTVMKASNDEKEFSIESRGAGSTLYGGRYDWIWFDDIQSDRNLEQTEKLLRYIRQTALTRPDLEKGFITFTGSRVGPTDIYHKMIEEEVLDQVVTIPALDRWVERDDHFSVVHSRGKKKVVVNPDCPAVPTWDRFSLQRLAELRQKVGEEIWSRTYMQRSFDSAAQTFTEEMIDGAKDRERTAGPARLGTDVIGGIDPAFDSGRCAFVMAGVDSGRMWVLDALVLTDVTRYEDIYGQMAAWSARYRPSTWIVEQNNFQRGLPQDDRVREMERRFNFRTLPHQTSRNKNDSVLGVGMMASAFLPHQVVRDGQVFSQTEISIPWGDDETARKMGDLTDELRNWRPRKLGRDLRQDLVMALWMVWLEWERNRRSSALKAKPIQIGGMPMKPLGYKTLTVA